MRLRFARAEQLLPRKLVDPEDSLSEAEFLERYGSVDDARFHKRVREIDLQLARSGIR
jgi:hypothetical protein